MYALKKCAQLSSHESDELYIRLLLGTRQMIDQGNSGHGESVGPIYIILGIASLAFRQHSEQLVQGEFLRIGLQLVSDML